MLARTPYAMNNALQTTTAPGKYPPGYLSKVQAFCRRMEIYLTPWASASKRLAALRKAQNRARPGHSAGIRPLCSAHEEGKRSQAYRCYELAKGGTP